MKLFIYTSIALLLFSCAPKERVSRVRVIHQKKWLADDLTTLHDRVLVLPIIYRGRFMEVPTITDISAPLNQPKNQTFSYYSYKSFLSDSEDEPQKKIVSRWEDALLDGDLTKSGEYGALFNMNSIRFVQVLTMNSLSRIRSENLVERRQLELEGEIWDLLRNESVWNAKIRVRTHERGSKDHEIIMNALKELYAELPTCYFSNKRSNF